MFTLKALCAELNFAQKIASENQIAKTIHGHRAYFLEYRYFSSYKALAHTVKSLHKCWHFLCISFHFRSRLQAVPFWIVERVRETGARRNKREEFPFSRLSPSPPSLVRSSFSVALGYLARPLDNPERDCLQSILEALRSPILSHANTFALAPPSPPPPPPHSKTRSAGPVKITVYLIQQ